MTEEMTVEEFKKLYARTGKGWGIKLRTPKGVRAGKKGDVDWEAALLDDILAAQLPKPTREYRFHHTRQWRVDFAWPALKVACEVEGGVYSGGRHVRGKGFEGDCVKYNELVTLGWSLIRVTPAHIKSGEAVGWLAQLVGGAAQ